jgi:phage shock protein C
MFCTQCGNQLAEGDRFCPRCGKPNGVPPGGPTGSQAAPPPAYAAPLTPYRPLRRVMRDKKIAGVCAGFAEYFDMDVTLMRIIFLVLLVTPPGVGLIGYLIAWVAMPRDS